jgi:hypothetical protein
LRHEQAPLQQQGQPQPPPARPIHSEADVWYVTEGQQHRRMSAYWRSKPGSFALCLLCLHPCILMRISVAAQDLYDRP